MIRIFFSLIGCKGFVIYSDSGDSVPAWSVFLRFTRQSTSRRFPELLVTT